MFANFSGGLGGSWLNKIIKKEGEFPLKKWFFS
jgi:hypothetical protein